MRITLIEASGRGFLSHYSHALAMGLQRAGNEVSLLTGLRDELRGWSIPFVKMACLDSGPRGWHCVRRQIEAQRPDIVHLQWVDNPLQALAFVHWAHRRGIRVIYTPHNILPHERRWLLMPLYRHLYRCLDRVVARDAHLAWALEELLDTPHESVAQLPGSPNFLALQVLQRPITSPLAQKQPGEIRLLFFGHGSRRKGLHELLTAIAESDWPGSMRLVIAGEEVLSGVSAQLLEAAGARMQLDVIGGYIAPEQVAAMFRDSDLLLMPYVKRCKSPLLDLAAALRLPVLRSDRVEGAVFWEGIHGATYPHAKPQAICGYLKETSWLKQVKKSLEALGDPVSAMDRLAAGHMQLYQELLESPRSASAGKLASNPPFMLFPR